MKIKIRSDDASVLQEPGWSQMGDWLAEFRDDSYAEPPGDDHAGAEPAGDPWPEALAQAEARARAQVDALAEALADAEARATERAVIGDELRIPVMWCEMGSCISWYTYPAALGEADTRARAIAVGWRIDALGRLACPQCQQADSGFWATCPVVPWDRYLAIARTARITAVPGDGSAGGGPGRPGRPASTAASPPEPPVVPGRSGHSRRPAGRLRPASASIRVTWSSMPPEPGTLTAARGGPAGLRRRATIADTLASLRAVRSAMDAERAPGRRRTGAGRSRAQPSGLVRLLAPGARAAGRE
jgi:hypothetical protein